MWQNLKNLAGKPNKHVIVQESGHTILTLAMFLYSCLHYLQWGWYLISAATKKKKNAFWDKRMKKDKSGTWWNLFMSSEGKTTTFQNASVAQNTEGTQRAPLSKPISRATPVNLCFAWQKKEKIKVGPLTVGVFAFQTCAKLPRCFFWNSDEIWKQNEIKYK